MHMIFWGDKPFARLCLVLICGIVLAKYLPYHNTYLYFVTLMILLVTVLSTYNKSRYREYWTGLLLMLSVIISGYTRYSMVHPIMDTSHYSHFASNQEVFISGEIVSIPKKTTRYSCFIKINAIGTQPDSLHQSTGKVAGYFKLTDEIAQTYNAGDEVLIYGFLSPLRHSSNPYAFDFNDYLKTKHVFHRLDIQKGKHHKTNRQISNHIENVAYSIRSNALKTFDKYLVNQNHKSLIKAMVLGFRNTISPSLYDSYTKTGAVHVLAVSGLHVGILCQFLLFFLNKIFKSSNKEKIIKIFTLGLCVTIYVIITGASPAVMRASLMIIIYYIGKYWADRVNKYNVLSLAAFLLLIYDPYMLFQASFQFSFLALLSIMYFYRRIYEWLFAYIEIKNRAINFLWQMIALSFSAQVLVAPLTVYYFHQFPLYFWLSGIVAVPAAYAILILGVLMIILEYIAPSLNIICEYLLTNIFKIFISGIQYIEGLPFATFENLWISTYQLVLLYLGIILYLIGKNQLKASYIISSAISLLIMISAMSWHNVKSNSQSNITFYENYKGYIIDFFDGDVCYTIYSQNNKNRSLQFITTNNRIFRKTKTVHNLNSIDQYKSRSLIKDSSLIQFKNESILLVDNNLAIQHSIITVDKAIVIGKTDISLDSIQKYIHAKKWIITQGESKHNQNKWLDWCKTNHIDCTSINRNGATSIDIK